MKTSVSIPVKTNLNSNLDYTKISNNINNIYKGIQINNDEKQKLINIGINNKMENKEIINKNNVINETTNNCNILNISNYQKYKLEKEIVSEFSFIKYDIYNKLINENKILIEKIKTIEKNHKNEERSLKEEIKRLKINKIDNWYENKLKQNLFNNNYDDNSKNIGINDLQKILENKDKEIEDYKNKIKKYQDDIGLTLEDFNEKKKELEKEIPELSIKLKKLEYDYNELQIELEKEKNKNIINNFIINEKNKELNNFKELFRLNKFNFGKFIKKDIDSQLILNFGEKMENNIFQEYNKNNYGKVGIINHGLNCYMSSVIQILKNIKKFGISILNYDKDDIITNSLRKVLNNLYYSNTKYISIKEFNKDFGSVYNKFEGLKQNDSTIFLIYLLQHLNKVFKRTKRHISSIYIFKDLNLNSSEENALEKFLDKYESNNNSYINDLFFGYQMNKLICIKCDYSFASYQSFIILDLPLINENTKMTCLEQSLNSYLITKDKHKTKGFECSNCGESYLSYLTSIIKLPIIMIINLKRVGENAIYYNEIEIPKILKTKSISKLNSFNKQYELIGFIKHFGNEKSGHNIAFSKNIFDNKWYSFDDHNVKEEKDFPSTDKSFLLFYQLIE